MEDRTTSILIVGYGEVGRAHAEVLAGSPRHEVCAIDIVPERVPSTLRPPKNWPVDVILFAMRYSDSFVSTCRAYVHGRAPKLIGVLSTVPPGTTKSIDSCAVHSTTRGLHPNLAEGLRTIPKHYGGGYASQLARIFSCAGIPTGRVHAKAATTELAHILNNTAYAVNCVLADEMTRVCRHYGVDYFEAVMEYTRTNNDGFMALGHSSKVRYILTPPGGHLGGHCIQQSAALIPKDLRGVLIDAAATYNADHKTKELS